MRRHAKAHQPRCVSGIEIIEIGDKKARLEGNVKRHFCNVHKGLQLNEIGNSFLVFNRHVKPIGVTWRRHRMVHALPKRTQEQQSVISTEDLYKKQVSRAIEKNGRDSLDTGIALLDLAELYDSHDQERDSEPIWREIEGILANYVKSGMTEK